MSIERIAEDLEPAGVSSQVVRQAMEQFSSLRALSEGTTKLATEMMRTSFATIKTTRTLLDAARLLLQTNQRGLPVLDDEGSGRNRVGRRSFASGRIGRKPSGLQLV
jgi:CBS domain-containing protein